MEIILRMLDNIIVITKKKGLKYLNVKMQVHHKLNFIKNISLISFLNLVGGVNHHYVDYTSSNFFMLMYENLNDCIIWYVHIHIYILLYLFSYR